MKNYNKIEQTCRQQSDLSKTFIDDFLIYYCDEREGLSEHFVKKLAQFRSIVLALPENWPAWAMSQYVAFRLFRKNGFAQQYINHAAILSRNSDEKELLSYQIAHPWRYTFCSVKNSPTRNFFEMVDVLTNEEFLLYSPGLEDNLKQQGPMQMFFYLIGFNGECWQTYGPHAYFRGLIPSDLLFYAKQIDPDIVFMNQIPALIDRDPLPWALLLKSGEVPLTFHKDDMVIMNTSEYQEENFEPDIYEDAFKIEKKYPLYQMSLKRWNCFPHFAAAYYHKKKKRLILFAMTDRGYLKLIEAFKQKGYDLPGNPENRVTLAMHHTAQEILGREILLNPYEKSFMEPVNQKDSAQLEKVNKFIKLLMDAHNSGSTIDIEGFADASGVNSDNAHQIAQQVMKTIDKMPKKR